MVLGGVIAFRWFKGGGGSQRSPAVWQHGALSCAVLVAYVMAMQVVGISYIIATMIFVPGLALVCGARSKRSLATIAGLGVVFACACFFIFTKVLVIDLP